MDAAQSHDVERHSSQRNPDRLSPRRPAERYAARAGPRWSWPHRMVVWGGPYLQKRHDVAVLDLSGHGDSDHREAYSPLDWADEIAAVIDDLAAGPAVVVAHSMGGHISALLASTRPTHVKALVLVDSRLDSEPFRAPDSKAVRYYPTREEGLSNFRLRPRGTSASPDLLETVAEYGLRHTAEGWRWKFDPNLGQPFTAADIDAAIAGTECPIGIIYGELSELASDASASMLPAGPGETSRVSVLPAPITTSRSTHRKHVRKLSKLS
ncbi:alpha/beta fold hydrolase [Aeromicrobium sp. UC242_57]|uniref:alpha/beta fold hydrolase n=1 Tax=Aeromicrobium sp. UC242_57 TaxID=3374624 RepID=UPI0037A45FAA